MLYIRQVYVSTAVKSIGVRMCVLIVEYEIYIKRHQVNMEEVYTLAN